MQAIIQNLLTDYQIYGSGPSILLLHGWADTKETFHQLAKKLGSNYKVITIDLPGFGKTQAPQKPFSLKDYAIFVIDFLKKINESPAIALGHSNGGAILIKMIDEELYSPKELILLASAGIRHSSSLNKQLLKILAKSIKIPLKLLPTVNQNKLKDKLYSKLGSDYRIDPNIQESFKLIVNEDITCAATKITCPTLIIYGSEDTSTPPEYGKQFQDKIPNSSLHILPSLGHFLHQSHTDQIYNLILKFLRDNG